MKRTPLRRWLGIVACASTFQMCHGAARSEEQPSFGTVYHTTENSSLTYSCRMGERSTLVCDFTQTSVRRKLSEEDARKRLLDARTQYLAKPEVMKPSECAEFAKLSDIMQGKAAAPDPAKLASVSQRQKADFAKLAGLIGAFCQTPSVDTYMKFIAAGVEKDKRTCLVSSHSFTQRLQQADGANWAVIPERQGPCGVVQLDRFEVDKRAGGRATFWNYLVRKAVTNRNAGAGLASCSILDEKEYKYEWRKRELDISCEYIDLSPV